MSPQREAIGPMLIAFLPSMRRFAISLTRSPDKADDLVQSACERALLNAESFQQGTRFDAWIFRIIRNLWIDSLRRTKTQASVPLDDEQEPMGADGEAVVDARLTLSDTAKVMLQLPEEQREVLMLVCVEGMSYAQAADVVGLPVGTVMSRLARGRTKLAALLGEAGIKPAKGRSSPATGETS
ncbi:MAG: RNA polymerase sigma factor [Pseudomonadota bacterium]